MTPFPQPITEIRKWLVGYGPTQGIRLSRSDWNTVSVKLRNHRRFVEEHLLGVTVELRFFGPRNIFMKYMTQFPERFYLELEDGQHALIIKDPTVKRGRFRG